MLGERRGRPRADRGDGRVGERAGVAALGRHRLEQQPRPIRAGQADERVGVEVGDRVADLIGLEGRLDPDRRQLHDLGAELALRRGEDAFLGAFSGEYDPLAV